MVLLWALPGSGRRRLLAALAAGSPDSLGVLTEHDASTDSGLVGVLERGRSRGVEQWVCDGWAPENVTRLLAHLRVGERIVASVDRAPDLSAGQRARVAVIGPREWLLERGEVERCSGGVSASSAGLDRRQLDELHAATGGWLRPVELALASGRERFDREALLQEASIRSFLGDRVVASLTEAERRCLDLAGRTDGEGDRLAELAGLERSPIGLLTSWIRPERAPRTSAAAAGELSRAFEVRLLGSPEVTVVGAGERLRWPYRRVVSLLALLVLEPDRSVPQERAVEALWPDQPIERARANLNPAVSHLRRWLSLGERSSAAASCVQLVNGVYRLNPGWQWRVDIEEFEAVARAEAEEPLRRLASLERARMLYRGPLLEGFRGGWMRERRRRLAARHRRLLRELGDLYASLGRLADSEDSYRSLLAVEPLEEDVHVAIMTLYARQGREDLVRRQFDKLAALLARELGIHPMDETIRAVQRLLGRE